MRKLAVTLSTVLIVITAPVLVAAADLFTPLLVLQSSLSTSPEAIACTVLNVSSKTVSVTMRIMLADGTPGPTADHTLDPGQGAGFLQGAGGTGISFRYCQFTVDGPKGAVRAGAMVKPNNQDAFGANTFYPAE